MWTASASIRSRPDRWPCAGSAVHVPPMRAGEHGVARVLLENAGTATGASRGRERRPGSYHWLDLLGNPIVWDGARTPFPQPVAPGRAASSSRCTVDAPAAARALPARVRPRRGAPLLVRGARLARRSRSRSTSRRGSPSAGSRFASTAATDAATTPRRSPPGGAVVRRRTARLSPTSSPAPSRPPTGRAASSTPTPRAGRPSAGGRAGRRPLEPARRAQLARWRAGGGRNPRFAARCSCPSLLAGLEPSASTSACPA